jgi:hypothetical protein
LLLSAIGGLDRDMQWERETVVLKAFGSVLVFFILVPSALHAAGTGDMVDPARETAVRGTSDFGFTQGQLFQLGFVALLGLATLVVQTIVLFRSRASSQATANFTIVTLIITLAVGTLVMGYDERQIAPVIGLFGSIVGYLLGRGDREAARIERRETERKGAEE